MSSMILRFTQDDGLTMVDYPITFKFVVVHFLGETPH